MSCFCITQFVDEVTLVKNNSTLCFTDVAFAVPAIGARTSIDTL